jgi:beta-lactam-binding protein with PASTA domain
VSVIRYDNLNVELNGSHGALITRLTQRQASVDSFSRRPLAAPSILPAPGREQQVADALRAIEQGHAIEFHAGCGYGKTTLLQRIAASAADRHPAFSCVYLRADGDRVEDLLQQLVTELYRSEQRVKLTPAECAQLLHQESLVIAVDDAPSDPAQLGYLLDVLPGSRFVFGCGTGVPVRSGSSRELPGLPVDAALSLLTVELGRALTGEELAAARDLAASVGGQPLHLKQAAALVRGGSHSLTALARQAADDPATLDRLSISSLTDRERRALAVLAFAAGALLPGELVDVIGQAAQLAECLTDLHRKGLAEQRRDRFGLPVCKAASYRAMLLGDLQVGGAAGALVNWLADRHPSASESQSAAEAVLAILDFAAECREWTTVVQLTRIAEQIVFIAGRWEAWHHVLRQGLAAAKGTGDSGLEAYFCHQLGSLELCLGRLDDATRLLQQALAVRQRIGDTGGADITRQNLQLLGISLASLSAPQESQPSYRPSRPHRVPVLLVLVAAATAIGLIVAVAAVAGVLRHSPPPAHPVLPSTTSHPPTSTGSPAGDQVKVPAVTGQASTSAVSVLQAAGLAATTTTTGNCDAAFSGNVLSQSPAAGKRVGKGTSVMLIVCSPASTPPPPPPPPVTVKVPNVLGSTQQNATATLQGTGLSASTATTGNCGAADNGQVLSQSPAAGREVAKGTSVMLSVCSLVAVPNVVDQNQKIATTTLQGDGFTVNVIRTTSCGTVPVDSVVSQDPAASQTASSGSAVTITVCAVVP